MKIKETLTAKERRYLREYYRGSRSPRCRSAHQEYLRLKRLAKNTGRILDDGLKYPTKAQPRLGKVPSTPKWAIVQAHRMGLVTILLPEAERMLSPGPDYASPEPLTRYRLLKILGIPVSSSAYNLIAPKLTEEQAVDLTDRQDMGKLPKSGMVPWHPWLKADWTVCFEPWPYPPKVLIPYFSEAWLDKYCLDYEGLLGEPEPVEWETQWSITRLDKNARRRSQTGSDKPSEPKLHKKRGRPKKEAPAKSDETSETNLPTQEQVQKIFDLFD